MIPVRASKPIRERVPLIYFVVVGGAGHFGGHFNQVGKGHEGSSMLIQEMTWQASLDFLARTHLGRLACAQGAQPYIVPIYFSYNNDHLYTFSTIGQKIEWMRANPLVCVEADEVLSSELWISVIVFGRFQELPDVPEWRSERSLAHDLLQRKAMWWEPGYVRTILHGTERPLVPVFYRIHITEITGHRAIPESGNAV
ncbi:MAG: pyridoxamine 5'-phosphate oxidase family protein [Candidatus Acidiferrales bacterium]|jgi:nitroimidazol reductase NimA-like FMN-containing flavoprotein (pyridoxamine 5'-phosphate oxidase superfamily)